MLGSHLWEQLTDAIILTEQMRVQDPQYQQLLERVSEGCGTQQDYQLLCTRIIGDSVDIKSDTFMSAPMIIPGNKLVDKLNWIHAESHASEINCQLLISEATDICKSIDLCDSKQKQLSQLTVTKSGNLPRQCPLFPGMPIKLTENIAVELGLSNSTSGIIKDVVYDPRERIQNTKQHILQYPPLCVIVTMHKSTCPQLQELAPHDVPIFSTSKSFQYKFPGMKKPVSITRRQLPLVPAYAYTSYKSQAQTLPAAVVDLVIPQKMPVKDTSFAYVPLSRVRKLSDLAILRRFDIKVLQKQKTSDHIKQDAKFELMSN